MAAAKLPGWSARLVLALGSSLGDDSNVNAQPALARITAALVAEKLETILVGNAAAALQGAPVTTLDFDFLFRATPANIAKLKRVAKALDAVIMRPFYPVSNLYRLENPEQGLQLDFMPKISGVRSMASLRSRASVVTFGTAALHVASLEDIIHSKRVANRPRDRAVLPTLEKTLAIKKAEKK